MRCLIFLSCLGLFPSGGRSLQGASAVGDVGEAGRSGLLEGGSGRSLPGGKAER